MKAQNELPTTWEELMDIFDIKKWMPAFEILDEKEVQDDIDNAIAMALISMRTELTNGIPEDELNRLCQYFREGITRIYMANLIIRGLAVPTFHPWQDTPNWTVTYRGKECLLINGEPSDL